MHQGNGTTHAVIDESKRVKTDMKTPQQLCRHCGFHPASPRIFGYCSWDCHDADDEDTEEERRATAAA